MEQRHLAEEIEALEEEIERLHSLRQRFSPPSASDRVGGDCGRVQERIGNSLAIAAVSLERDTTLLASQLKRKGAATAVKG